MSDDLMWHDWCSSGDDDDNYVPRENGYYEAYDKDGLLRASFNIYNEQYYGKCLYCDEYGNIILWGEFNAEENGRTINFNSHGKRTSHIVEQYGETHIKYLNDDDVYYNDSFIDIINRKFLDGSITRQYIGKMKVNVFHYGDGKISYREKDDKIIHYYKNGYIKRMYKSKKLFFY